MSQTLSPAQTAAALPYGRLASEIQAVLQDPDVHVLPRTVQPLHGGGSLFVMPAADKSLAITKIISFIPDNHLRGLPAIQGDIVLVDAQSGQRFMLIDGPTVTARRTAAVSLLAAQTLAPCPQGPLLIVGAGVQGRSHLEAFHQGLGVTEVWVASRSESSARTLVAYAQELGMQAQLAHDPDLALAHCTLVVTTTSAQGVVMHQNPRSDAFVSAVGAFTPKMVEWSAEVCQHLARVGSLVVDTRDADHEAGDLLQAGIDVTTLPTLADVLRRRAADDLTPGAPDFNRQGPVFFKSCGWAGWDLAAARCLVTQVLPQGR
jgi:ornithine cyclodeaminase